MNEEPIYNLERAIHDFLVFHCGTASNVKGISTVQLSKLKLGTAGISTTKLKEILRLNGISGRLILESKDKLIKIEL